MKRDIIKDYFSFSAKERNAVVILFIVMGIFFTLPYVFNAKEKPPLPDEKLLQQTAQLQNDSSSDNLSDNSYTNDVLNKQNATGSSVRNIPYKKDSLFYFDPNTMDENGWKILGLSDKNIHTIFNYRNKGGKFYKPADISKIYGISANKAGELIPYIRIQQNKISFKPTAFIKKNSAPSSVNFQPKKLSAININTASAEDFKNLPGIGDVLSKRIIKFRNAIGGFKNIDDLKKTYGLNDSVFQIIRPYLQL